MSEKYDIFISHSNKDREWTRRLVEELSRKGISIWYDELNIKPGDSIMKELEQGLRDSKYVILLLTPDTLNSNWSAAELGAALAMKKSIIPIVSEETPLVELPGPIRSRRFLQKGDPIQTADEIARSIVSISQEHDSEASGTLCAAN